MQQVRILLLAVKLILLVLFTAFAEEHAVVGSGSKTEELDMMYGEIRKTARQKPNIIFIFADDWGWGDVSWRNELVDTPNLDILRQQGTEFFQFNVVNPVCSPSRVAVMTGQYPARFGVHQHMVSSQDNRERNMADWLDVTVPMLPRLLQDAGYATAHFGKWHLTAYDFFHQAPTVTSYGYDEARVVLGQGTQTRDRFAETIDFITRHREQPFFINLWLHQTHTPHMPSEEGMERFSHLDEQQQVYSAVVWDGDQGIGQVMAAVRELGLAEQTLVIFSSDNGPEVTGGDDRRFIRPNQYGTYFSVGSTGGLAGRKRSLFEGGVRTPFIAWWPGQVPAGTVDETTVIAAVDLLPTFAALAEIELPPTFVPDGENMLPALLGHATQRTTPIFWEWRGNHAGMNWPEYAVRDGDWKLVVGRNRVELYNVVKDWREQTDVSAQDADLVHALQEKLQAWIDSLPHTTRQLPPANLSPGKIYRTNVPAVDANHELRYAFDGNTDTWWTPTTTDAQGEIWLAINLLEFVEVTRIAVSGQEMPEFDLQYSDHGLEWKDISILQVEDSESTRVFDFLPITASYVRLVIPNRKEEIQIQDIAVYSDPVGALRLQRLQLRLPEELATQRSVSGEVSFELQVDYPPEEVDQLAVVVTAKESQQEVMAMYWTAEVPDGVTIDTRDLADGAYTVMAYVQTNGMSSTASLEFYARNHRTIVDRFLPPADLGVFGVRDRSLTLDESSGWRYNEESRHLFFGEQYRKVRQENTSEYLIWSTPSLRFFEIAVYATEAAIEQQLEIMVSSHGQEWGLVPYWVEIANQGEQWFHLVVTGRVASGDVFRLRLRDGPLGAEDLQLGSVRLTMLAHKNNSYKE